MKKLIFTLFLILIIAPFTLSQTCGDSLVYEIDMIKQSAETMLAYSNTAEVTMESGEKLLAFYFEGKLIKLTVDNSGKEGYYIAELFFKEGFIRHIAEEYRKDSEFYKDYYYFKDDKLICYTNEKTGEYKDKVKYSDAEKLWLEKVEKYLHAVQ